VNRVFTLLQARTFCQDPLNDFPAQLRFLSQGFLRGLFALADQLAIELQPGAFFLHDALFDPHLENTAFFIDAVIIDDVELCFGKGRRDLFFTTFTLTWLPIAFRWRPLSFPCGGCRSGRSRSISALCRRASFPDAEHDTDLFRALVGENARGLALCQMAVSLRKAWLIRRCLHAHRGHAISPSSSAFGTSAATESITITSSALETGEGLADGQGSSPLSG